MPLYFTKAVINTIRKENTSLNIKLKLALDTRYSF